MERIGGDSSPNLLLAFPACFLRNPASRTEGRGGAYERAIDELRGRCSFNTILHGTGYSFKKGFPGIDGEITVPIQTFREKPFALFFGKVFRLPAAAQDSTISQDFLSYSDPRMCRQTEQLTLKCASNLGQL